MKNTDFLNEELSDNKNQYIWMNGEFILWDQAKIHVLTHSLHYSGAVFEGEKSYNGEVFKIKEHTERLIESAKLMNMTVDYSVDDIIKATYDLLKKNQLSNAYLRPLIWRGGESLGLTADCKTNILILAKFSETKMQNNLNLCVSPWRKPDVNAMPPQSKSSAHYAMMKISQQYAHEKGYNDALMLDPYDNIAESTTTNIFFAKGDLLITPLADRFLNGITRQTIIELASDLGLKAQETRIVLDDIQDYDACFLTGTAAEVRSVSSITTNDKKIDFTNQKLVYKIQKAYAKLIGKNYGI